MSTTMLRAVVVATLALVTLALAAGPHPSNVAVATWIASILVGFDAFERLDRHRREGEPAYGRREKAVVATLMATSLVLSLHDLTHWRWSGTPDEAHFFNAAKAMATGELQPFLLSELGVFGVHPVLSSAYQALFMWVFGANAFAWRLSSAAAVALAVPCLYALARDLWGSGVATTATLLFVTTPLVVGFAHLGYNNTQIYPIVLGALAAVVSGHRSGSLARLYFAGFVAGLGFYTFYPARVTPALALLLGFFLGTFTVDRDGLRRTAAFLAGAVLTVLPVAMALPQSLARVSELTSFAGGGGGATIASHWLQAIVYPVYFVGPHHFQWSPIVDPVSGPLSLAGLVLCLFSWRRGADGFLAAAYLIAALVVGATSHHERPPLTRLLFLSPFVALLAAVALQRIADFVAARTGRSTPASAPRAVVVGIAVLWSVVWLQYNVRYRYHGCGDGTTTEAVRVAMRLPNDTSIVYFQRVGSTMIMVDAIFDQYGMAERLVYAQGMDARTRQALETLEPPLAVLVGLQEGDERRAVEGIVERRFPGRGWTDSDPGQPWNLRYSNIR